MHFHAREGAQCPADVEDPELGALILQVLDGSRSVREVADQFPNRRFLTYKLLSDFVRDRLARPTGTDDLLAIAQRFEVDDLARARKLVRRGLDSEPHHPELLAAEARLAERDGDAAAAAGACKLLAHLELENGQTAEALAHLEQAKRLTPADPTLWERTLALALSQGRQKDAVAEGMRLLELYRAPGLHNRAKDVLERLLEVDADSVELHLEFARSRVDCGESAAAVKHLARRGKAFISKANYLAARALYQEILDIEPGNREAALSIELIDKETFARRRERKRRIVRWFATAVVAAAVGTGLALEVRARWAYVELRSLISRERMIERQQYVDAILLVERLRADHPFTLTGRLDVPRFLDDLAQRRQEIGEGGRAGGR
jgi:tetratricopeptide (TPR) repeat protein